MEGQRKGMVLVEGEGIYEIKIYPNTTDKVSHRKVYRGKQGFIPGLKQA